MTDPHAEARRQVRSDLGLMREMADAVDQDRGHNKSLLTRLIRGAADDIRDLSAREERLREALERLLYNAQLIFNKQPVRDWGETLAEAKAALSTPEADGLDVPRNQDVTWFRDSSTPEADEQHAEARAEHLREAREVEAWQEAKHARREEGSP